MRRRARAHARRRRLLLAGVGALSVIAGVIRDELELRRIRRRAVDRAFAELVDDGGFG